MHQRTRQRRGRLCAAMRSAAVSGLALSLVAAPSLAAMSGPAAASGLPHAASQGGADQLDHVGTIRAGNLTLPNGTHPTAEELRAVGVDTDLGDLVLFAHAARALIRVSTTTLTQTAPATSTSFPPSTDQSGQTGAVLVHSATHTVLIGRAPSYVAAESCNVANLACAGTGPTAIPASIAAVPLGRGHVQLYQFPDEFNGYNVIGMTSITAPDGRDVLFALLYLDAGNGQASATIQGLRLVALDLTSLETGKPGALLWTYAVPACMSTASWAVHSRPDFLGVDSAGRFAYFACRGVGALADAQPPGAVVVDFPTAFPNGPSTSGFSTSIYPFGANTEFGLSGGDQQRGLVYVIATSPNKVYVFDTEHRNWTGSVPFSTGSSSITGLLDDPSTGTGYAVYDDRTALRFSPTTVPVSQGTTPSYEDVIPTTSSAALDASTHRLFITGTSFTHPDGTPYPADVLLMVFEDHPPVPAPPELLDPDAETHDVPITPQTPVKYGAFASAYGTRASAVGGIHSTAAYAVKVGDAPGISGVANAVCNFTLHNVCLAVPVINDGHRTLTLARLTNTELSSSAAKSDAAPATLDTGTVNDASGVQSYNPADLFAPFTPPGTGLPTPPPEVTDARNTVEAAATAPVDKQQAPAECLDFGDTPSDASTAGASAVCNASRKDAQGSAAMPSIMSDLPLQVAYSGVSADTSEVDGHAVTRVIAAARGISLTVPGGGSVQIGEVLTTATTIAAGRTGTARSEFTRSISDLAVRDSAGKVVFACGFGGPNTTTDADKTCDARQITDAVSEVTFVPVLFRTPSPDPLPAVAGSPGGAQAAVIKDVYTRWNDYFTNGDDGFEVPGLEVDLIADQNQPSRLVLQFAGVHAESHFAIGIAPPQPPPLPAPTLKITLLDASVPPVPLSGATFSVVGPTGAEPRSCVTAADGVGTCSFADFVPGTYTLRETSAPPGFAAAPDFQLPMEAGQAYSTTFVNLRAIGSVTVSLLSPDDPGVPLEGAEFAMYKGDSALDSPVASCTTNSDGTCGFNEVPLGPYTMQQVRAPDGYLVTDAAQFSLTEPGQSVTLHFVDGTPAIPPVPPVVIPGEPPVPPTVIPGKPPVPPKVIPGKPAVPPHTIVLPIEGGGNGQQAFPVRLQPVSYQQPTRPMPVVQAGPATVAPPVVLGGAPAALLQAPARMAQLAMRSPRQALLVLLVWLLLGLPPYLWARRRQLLATVEGI